MAPGCSPLAAHRRLALFRKRRAERRTQDGHESFYLLRLAGSLMTLSSVFALVRPDFFATRRI